MRYQVRKSYVIIIGKNWYGQTCSLEKNLTDHDLCNISAENITLEKPNPKNITRDTIEQWLTSNSGDFSSVDDFKASISLATGEDFDLDFSKEESEMTYANTLSDYELQEDD